MATLSDTVTLRAETSGAGGVLALPPEMLDLLGMAAGTVLNVVPTQSGILLHAGGTSAPPTDVDFAGAMEAFERVSAQYKNTLRELAK